MTPMQEQYNSIKSEYQDYVILFRLGDFYEAFENDAVTISKVLGITLTSRGKDENKTPLAGIPHHALPTYLPKLIEAGLKVVIADQMEEAVPGKLVKRQVTKIITPGTVLDESSLDSSKNNFIASIFYENGKNGRLFGLVYCDITTGLVRAFETNSEVQFKMELNKIRPSELLFPSNIASLANQLYSKGLQELENKDFEINLAEEVLKEQFKVLNFKGFGLDGKNHLLIPAGGLIKYLNNTQKTGIQHIKSIQHYQYTNYMQLDPETIRNLELLFPMNNNDVSNTLYGILSENETSMGKRKLRQWILYPLINSEILQERLDAVDFFFNNPIINDDLRENLKNIADIERIIGRIGVSSANPKDLNALVNGLNKIFAISEILKTKDLPIRIKYFASELAGNGRLNEVMKSVNKIVTDSIKEDPSVLTNEGGIIKKGFNSEVDELNEIRHNTKAILAQMQKDESEKTKIPSLKISYNSVFGYYIEVTRSHMDKVPEHYIRKQTLANAERFITQELKTLEEKILSAEDKLIKLEQELFFSIRNSLVPFIEDLLKVSDIIAEIDLLSSFGFTARKNKYTKPEIKKENILEINGGRHPVIENIVNEFTVNETEFNDKSFIHILTGPNMSGKSTYIRQVALIVLMAQIGSFVPAKSMKWKLIDRIFTRVGASDNLSRGESTFMVEMNETANILNNATKESLVILDEVGRGTSTYDGVAIAWSIIEFIFHSIKCKTLFATHYHELIDLEKKHEGIKNYNVEVLEEGSEIIFKHKIIKGATNKSYGVHVAKLAGIPEHVVKRASEILKDFEGDSKTETKSAANKATKPKRINPDQLGLI